MSFVELIFLSIALSMDAFAVSITNGMSVTKVTFPRALSVGLTFGIFQAIMPLVGFIGGSFFYEYIKKIDHVIAFILLGVLGTKMIIEVIKESMKKDNSTHCQLINLTPKLLFVQGIATSIDALAVGISLAAINANIKISSLIIGITTTIICLPAVYIGKKTGEALNSKAQLVGGLILVGIGIKIFVEHLLTD